MSFTILLERASFMRFITRNYRILAPQPLEQRILGELKLGYHEAGGALT